MNIYIFLPGFLFWTTALILSRIGAGALRGLWIGLYIGSSLSWYLPGLLEAGGIHRLADTFTCQKRRFD